MGRGSIGDDAHISSDEDMRLMTKAQTGDREAFARLYEKYAPVVRRHLAGHRGCVGPPDDLVQEVFTRIWERHGKYQPGMAVKSYLLGFAKNVYKEHLARAYREITTERRESDLAANSVDPGPDTVAQHHDQAERIRSHLTELPPRQRQALELVCLKGLSSMEVSRLLGCSDRTVRANYRMGLRKLKTLVRNSQNHG